MSISKITKHLREEGLISTLRWGMNSVFYYPIVNRIDHQFDRRYGTDTSRYLDPSNFRVDSEMLAHANEYSPSPDSVFRRFLKQQRLDFADYTFIDLGCGKGRTLMLASQFPFRKVIGVEFEPNLHGICKNNIRIYSQNCKRPYAPMEAVCGDAGAFAFPEGNILLYLFNPFDGFVMNRVVERLVDAIHAGPRTIRIIYFHPNFPEPFYSLPNVRVVSDKTFRDRKSLNDLGHVLVFEVATE